MDNGLTNEEKKDIIADSSQAENLEAPTTEIEDETVAGISDSYDAYGREVLERTFENILCQSKNIVKLNYSKVKNEILSYKGMTAAFDGEEEVFTHNGEKVFVIRLNGNQVLLYSAINSEEIDRKSFPHKVVPKKEAISKVLPIVFTVRIPQSLKNVIFVMAIMATKRGYQKVNAEVYKPYAEKYPVNPNAVLAGDEDTPPVENQYAGPDYEDIIGEVTAVIMEENFGKVDRRRKKPKGEAALEKQRQTSKTIMGAIALAQPIVYFYNVAVDKEGNVRYVNVQQVLNDKFLGKLVPQQYFAVAEGSDRIEQLNILALKEVLMDCERHPEVLFAVTISCRMIAKQSNLKRLIKEGKTEKNNLMLVFDASLLEDLGDDAKNAIKQLRNEGFSIMLDNVENAGLRALSEFEADYIRVDARYYPTIQPKKAAELKTLTGYAKVIGVTVSAQFAETAKEAVHLFTNGAEAVEGFALGEPRRIAQVAMKERRKLPAVRG